MNVNEHMFGDINTHRDLKRPPCIGIIPDALLKVQKPVLAEDPKTEVSTRTVLSGNTSTTIKNKPKKIPNWYACRVTNGWENQTSDYLVGKNIEVYRPTIKTLKNLVFLIFLCTRNKGRDIKSFECVKNII